MKSNAAGTLSLRHASPTRNRKSILARGLLAKMSQGKARRVWLHSPEETLWALQHVAKRHSCRPIDCDVHHVQVDPTTVRRGPRKGLYWIPGDVPVCDLLGVRTAFECLCDPTGDGVEKGGAA